MYLNLFNYKQGGRKQLHQYGLYKRVVRARPHYRPGRTLPGPEASQAASVPSSLGRHHLHVPSQLSNEQISVQRWRCR